MEIQVDRNGIQGFITSAINTTKMARTCLDPTSTKILEFRIKRPILFLAGFQSTIKDIKNDKSL